MEIDSAWPGQPVRVLRADDHAVMRESLRPWATCPGATGLPT